MTGEGRNPDRVPLHQQAISLPVSAIGGPVRPLEPPVAVRVWVVRSRIGWVQLEGEANAFTRLAAHVQFRDEHGRADEVWVWAGGVERRI